MNAQPTESQSSFVDSTSAQLSKQILSLLVLLDWNLLMCLEWAESTASRLDTLRKFSNEFLIYTLCSPCILLVEHACKLYSPSNWYWFASIGIAALLSIYCALTFTRLVLCLCHNRLGSRMQIHVNSANLNLNENVEKPEVSPFEPPEVVPQQTRLQVALRARIPLRAVVAMVHVKLRSCVPQFIVGLSIGLLCFGIWLIARLLIRAGVGP